MAEEFEFACIRGQLKAANMSDSHINALEEAYHRLRRAHPTEPHPRIAERLLAIVQDKRQVRLALGVAQARAQARIQEYVSGGTTTAEKIRRARFIISRDQAQQDTFSNNFEATRESFLIELTSLWADAIQKLSPRWFHAVQDRALVDDVGRALWPDGSVGASGDAVNLARGIRTMMDAVPTLFREYGVRISNAENFIPARHTAARIRAVPYKVWRDKILETNDFSQKIDRETGEIFEPEALEEVLRRIHKSITSGGLDMFEAFNMNSPKAFTARMEESRFFVWKDYDSWKAYQREFGEGGNLMEALVLYQNAVARDLAILQTLGPDPAGTISNLKAVIRELGKTERAETPASLLGRVEKTVGDILRGNRSARSTINRIDTQWKLVTGEFTDPENRLLAAGFEITQTLVRLATLGGSGLPAFNDNVFASGARHYFGLAEVHQLPAFIREMKTVYDRGADPRMLQKLRGGMGAETMLAGLIGHSRAQGEYIGTKMLFRIQDGFFRANMTTPITQAVRNGADAATSIGLRTVVEDGLEAAPPRLRAALEKYGVTDGLLARLRGEEYRMEFSEGAGLDLPAIIRDFGRDAAMPFIAITQDIRYMSSPTPSVDNRAFFAGEAGTLRTALWQSFAMFWQFPMAAFQTQILRRLYNNPPRTALAQIAALTVVGTMLGAVIVQSRQIANGKTPMDWESRRLWLAAGAMSGMAGVWGDYVSGLFYDNRRVGTDLLGPVVGGPIAGLFETGAAVAQTALGEEANIVSPALRTLRSVTPGINFPFIGPAIQQSVFDQAELLSGGSRARKKFRAQAKRLQETGQRNFLVPHIRDPIAEALR